MPCMVSRSFNRIDFSINVGIMQRDTLCMCDVYENLAANNRHKNKTEIQ